MIVLAFSLLLLGSATEQGNRQDESAPAPRAPTSSSAVRTITTQATAKPGEETRTVCGWEAATGSTMRRRVCREAPVPGSAAELEAREMLRNIQGSRYGERPIARQPGGRSVF